MKSKRPPPHNGGWLALSQCYWGDSPQVRLEGPSQLGLFALALLVGSGVWLQFLRRNWRTLGDPLPPDSFEFVPASSAANPPERLAAGG